MSIFQKSVISKYLQNQSRQNIEQAYQKYKETFTTAKIKIIRKMKEEEYQDGFLRDLFVGVLGYAIKPENNYYLVREKKNITDSKKVDGALLKDGKIIAVIELKSTKTKDMKTITEQAFNYKNNHPACKYVITSNFMKLRFYIEYSNEYEEFHLFNLSFDKFQLLYLVLQKDNLFSSLPYKFKEESIYHEEKVSKNLYNDYSSFKNKLYENLIKNNSEYDKLTLFKKSQKLLDRFLFILFAEDRGLLPPNSINRIIKRFRILEEENAYKPLYDIYKQYFGYMNIGRNGKTPAGNIPAYNGGLFYPDETLDALKIDDDILIADLEHLSTYDFSTEVDVNILGHIFEHSLTEIEEVTAEIEGTKIDKTKSKRKKDGVFYTPKYITQYIVENTLGELCREKRTELGIDDIEIDDSFQTKKGDMSQKGQRLYKKFEDYKNWLLLLKIVDPACGSGAFLNQALNFLINEHNFISESQTELKGGMIELFNIEKAVLENNLFGVDINEESVEIAQLSLWLRTAKKGRKLSVLSNNIKCGNSLIDDPTVAGDKAFDWYAEFPQVFQYKKKHAYHITWVTHNARTSQRMIDYKVKKGDAYELSAQEEIIVTQAIADKVKDDNLNVLAYNICQDHVHLLLVCGEKELNNIVRKLKGKSAQELRKHHKIPKNEKFSLWGQKFNRSYLDKHKKLLNTIPYIENNRIKHNLPANKDLQPLVKDMICTYDHAFRDEYTGGFDVVIGNPPYLRVQGLRKNFEEESKFYEKYYDAATGRFDIYVLFIEMACKLIKLDGKVSFILPHKFLISEFGEGIRNYLKNNHILESIVHFGSEMVFEDVSTYTCIIKLSYNNQHLKFTTISPKDILKPFIFNKIDYSNLTEENWLLKDTNTGKIINKILSNKISIKQITKGVFQGIISGDNKAFYLYDCISNNLYIEGFNKILNKRVCIEKSICKKLANGKNIERYAFNNKNDYIIYPYNKKNNKTVLIEKVELKEKFPKCYNYFLSIKHRLENRGSKNMTYPKWYSLWNYRNKINLESSKILTPDVCYKSSMYFDKSGELYHNDTTYSIILKNPSKKLYLIILGILNSNLFWFYLKNISSELRGGYFRFKTKYIEPFSIPDQSINSQDNLEKHVENLLSYNQHLHQKKTKFLNRVKDNLAIEKISRKLDTFYDHDFKTFVTEVNKALKKRHAQLKKELQQDGGNKGFQSLAQTNSSIAPKLSLQQQDEWADYFTSYKKEINDLQQKITTTDKEIDNMVYNLYGLTEEEIKIVEAE
ncbi:MAG: Eco57I restriction-modification methylase domain-containing protein [Fidelibacterota bacterium]